MNRVAVEQPVGLRALALERLLPPHHHLCQATQSHGHHRHRP